jgi:hypothetical protein
VALRPGSCRLLHELLIQIVCVELQWLELSEQLKRSMSLYVSARMHNDHRMSSLDLLSKLGCRGTAVWLRKRLSKVLNELF